MPPLLVILLLVVASITIIVKPSLARVKASVPSIFPLDFVLGPKMVRGLEPPEAITAWYAIDDSDCENGCMRVIPGTHHGIQEHGKSDKAGNLLISAPTIVTFAVTYLRFDKMTLTNMKLIGFILIALLVISPSGPHRSIHGRGRRICQYEGTFIR